MIGFSKFSVAFSENNEWLASGSGTIREYGDMKIWDTSDWSEITTLTGYSDVVKSVDFSENNQWLASGSYDNTIKIWDTSDWSEITTLTGHSDDVRSVDFSENNQWLSSGTEDETIKIWDTSDWSEITTLTGHSSYVVSVDFSENNQWLASSSWDGKTKIWNTSDWSEIKTLAGYGNSIEFSENNEWLASGNYDNTIKIWGNAPDLTIKSTDITFSRENIIAGETVTINVTIQNIGLENATGVKINFYDDEEIIGSDIIDVLAGETETASIEWDVPSSLGNHTIYVKIDEENKIFEENETNNIASYDVNVRGADLTLSSSDIIFSKEFIISGETVTIFAEIENIGFVNATNVKTNFYDGSTLIGSDTIDVLAGVTETASIEWDVQTCGNHTIYVKIDEENKIFEENENNNIASYDVNVRGVDLTLSSSNITFSKENIISGETVTIYAEIHNIGILNATNVKINFYDDSTLIGSNTINILAGEKETASIEWDVPSSLGNHTIYVKIDEENKIFEENENNNNASIEVNVTEKDKDGFSFILIIPIVGIIVVIGIIGFIMHGKKSSITRTPPTLQQTQFQQKPHMQAQQFQQIPLQQSLTQPFQQPQMQPITQICPFCNAQVPIQFKFCNMCGKQIKN